jgi:hypothetical protein
LGETSKPQTKLFTLGYWILWSFHNYSSYEFKVSGTTFAASTGKDQNQNQNRNI